MNLKASDADEIDRWAYERQSRSSNGAPGDILRGLKRKRRYYRVLLRDHLPEDKTGLVLDLPCGEGGMVWCLKRMGYSQVQGYDLDAARIAIGLRLNLPLYEGDVFAVLRRQGNCSVAAIFAMDFLEHLDKAEGLAFLKLAHQKLRVGGRLLVRTPCADAPQGMMHVFNDFTHKSAVSAGVLRWLLESVGFERVHVFGEHPKVGMSMGLLRVPAFTVSTAVAGVVLRAMGLAPYSIWSSSMWGVGDKKAEASTQRGNANGQDKACALGGQER